MTWKTLDDLDLAGKVVLTRVDINVPMENARVSDSTRITRIIPTVNDILTKGGKPVLLAHFARPKGKIVPEMSLKPLLSKLTELLGHPVHFAADCIGEAAASAIEALPDGAVLLLENTRFHAGEENNDPEFAAELAKLGDVYCNDAFSAAHRAHASTEALARLLPNCAGRLMAAELSALNKALGAPERPVTAVVGGAKVSTKLDLLSNLITKVDHLVIGGGMANTFLAAKGFEIGKSLAEHELTPTARDIMEKAAQAKCTIHLPRDIVVARDFKANAEHKILPVDQTPADMMILDAGPESVTHFGDVFAQSRTLIWNGPLGAFEIPPFDRATMAAAKSAAELTQQDALISVAGGGDTVAALNQAGVADKFSYLSTAGGAFLEWMEGKTLPGVAVLME